MSKEAISIVLVSPQGPRNIGSVCRVMANFGFSDLRLVSPEADHLSDEACHMAVSAKAMLRQAKVFDNLADAVADCEVAVATTRRQGQYRENLLTPDDASRKIVAAIESENRAAIVFGREDNGLTTAEIDQCQLLCSIPTCEELPSMNLAQAVTVVLYELHRKSGNNWPAGAVHDGCRKFASNRELEDMIQHMRQSLLTAGYLSPENPDHIVRTFRRIFGRAGLSPREVKIFQGLWSRIDWLCGKLGKDMKDSE